jgi:hypothetical protein
MRSLLLLVPFLGGCPPPSQFLITEVTAAGAPVADALVAADCGHPDRDAALRTDPTGRARLTFRRKVDASKCSVTVAKSGYPTAEAIHLSICTTPACPATHVELDDAAREYGGGAMRSAVLLLALAACDPIWGAQVTLRDPLNRSVENATLAVACDGNTPYAAVSMAVRTKHDGTGFVGSMGTRFPVGCDLFIAKPGFRTHHIAYRELCPRGPEGCERMFNFDLVLEPD